METPKLAPCRAGCVRAHAESPEFTSHELHARWPPKAPAGLSPAGPGLTGVRVAGALKERSKRASARQSAPQRDHNS